MKIDKTVKKETIYIAVWAVLLSLLMQSVFLIIGKWNYTVLLGNILGAATAVLNFLAMGMTMQIAVKKDEKSAKDTVKLSHTVRSTAIVIIAVIGVTVPVFNIITVLVSLFFPRIAIFVRPLVDKNYKKGGKE